MRASDAAKDAHAWTELRQRLADAGSLTSADELRVLRDEVDGLGGSVRASGDALDGLGVELQLRRFRHSPPGERLPRLRAALAVCEDALDDVRDTSPLLEARLEARRVRLAAEIAALEADPEVG